MNKGLRRPKVFKPGDKVYLRDQDSKWKIPAKVINQRKHQGFDTPSYLLKNLKTGTLTTRNKRDIRKFAGDEDTTTENTNEAPDNVNSVVTGIMKAPKYAESGADNAGSSQPGRDTESKTPDIKESQEPDTSVVHTSPHLRD